MAIFVATYYAWHSLAKDTSANSAVLALTLGFPNTAAVGIPLIRAVYGPQASVTVAIAIAMGAITITPITLAILESGTAEERELSPAVRIRRSAWGAMKNPVFWAPVLGAFVAFVKLVLPLYINSSLYSRRRDRSGAALFVTGVIASAQPSNLAGELAAPS